jgi:hypothetical protein
VKQPSLCRFCKTRYANVDAHIYPRSLVLDRSEPGKNTYLISARDDFARRSPTGVYDNELVCDVCEAGFCDYDTYGHQFFKLDGAAPMISSDGETLGWHTPVDYTKLKLFVLAILWRASASSRPECSQTKLGRFEEPIRLMINSGDPGPPERFPILMHRYDPKQMLAPMVMPYRTRLKAHSVNFYKLEMAGCSVLVAIDERKLPPLLSQVALAPDRPAYLFAKDYVSSTDWTQIVKIGRKIYGKAGRLPG